MRWGFSRVSAYSNAFAVQMRKKPRTCASVFYFWREKVSAWELSDDLCSAKPEHILPEKLRFSVDFLHIAALAALPHTGGESRQISVDEAVDVTVHDCVDVRVLEAGTA